MIFEIIRKERQLFIKFAAESLHKMLGDLMANRFKTFDGLESLNCIFEYMFTEFSGTKKAFEDYENKKI